MFPVSPRQWCQDRRRYTRRSTHRIDRTGKRAHELNRASESGPLANHQAQVAAEKRAESSDDEE